MYAIMNEYGALVSKAGMSASYTRTLSDAQEYETREQAERNMCPENEHVVNLEELLDELRR